MAKRIKIPEIYHETMNHAIDAAIEYAESKGYGVMTEEESGIIWEPMGYETYQTQLYHIYRENIVSKKCLNISLYRMPSGKYELTTYIN